MMPFKEEQKRKIKKVTSVVKDPFFFPCFFCAGVLTALLLQHPDLQLDEAVGVVAVVLPDAAVANLVAADVQLVQWTHRPDLGVTDCGLLQNVNQAPDQRTKPSRSSTCFGRGSIS